MCVAMQLGAGQSGQNNGVQPGVDQIDISAAGEPGFAESLIPVWGENRGGKTGATQDCIVIETGESVWVRI